MAGYNSKRRVEIPFLENGTTSAKLPRGILEMQAIISLAYSINVTVAGTAVRPRGSPIKRVQLIADGGKVLHTWKPQSLVKYVEAFEQLATGAVVSPLTGFGIGVQTGSVDLPLPFATPRSQDEGIITALPTWAYDELTVVVDWGNVTDVLVGAAAAGVTTAVDSFITLDGKTGLGNLGDGKSLARGLGVAVTSYREYASAAANPTFLVDLPRTADIARVIIDAEDTTNGNEPAVVLLNAITFLENNVVRLFSNVKGRVVRNNNAKVYGLLNGALPGQYVIDFAEDQSLDTIYAATEKDSAQLILDVAAGSFNIRVTTLGIEPPKAIA